MNSDQQHLHSARAARFKYMNGGKPLAGYTIQRGIGIGGFGEVYFACSDAGKQVALKRIQRNLDVELRGVQNCLNLKHVNLISLWDIRTDDVGECWVVMEYVPGPSLREIIEVTENGMPDHQIKRWFEPIASGVQYLHDKGIVHRDLKPANIFLDEDENVIKIGDYGLSKLIASGQDSGQTETVGTFHYMAPEIGKGIYGKGIDIYAMGIVLYEMLTGIVPFTGESSQEIIMKHLTTDPNLDQVPFEFREVIRRALLKDPTQRFKSIGEMCEWLPWRSDAAAGKFSNADRMAGLKVGRESTNGRLNGQPPANFKLPETLQGPNGEGGIRFGPLVDSNAGTRSDNELHYIGDTIPWSTNTIKPAMAQHRDEPIALAVRSGWSQFAQWWNDTTVSTPLKMFVLLAALIGLAVNSEWLLSAALGLGFLYLVYYGFRNLFYTPNSDSVRPASKVPSRKQQRQKLQILMRQHLASQDNFSRATSMSGSLLISAIVCIALNLLGWAISRSIFETAVESWALFTVSTMVCTLGSWLLLTLGKFFEGSDGESLPRRFAMLVIGLLLGGFVVVSGSYLNLDFARISGSAFNPLHASRMVLSDARPLVSSILFFAAVFGILRWWRQVDPTRRTRLSIWSVGLCLIWAAIFSHILNFAPSWSCMLVVIISIAIQLSSPWISKNRRQTLLKPENHPAI